jgi:ferric-dicitrate binding protein FerR (iron transport regulator)
MIPVYHPLSGCENTRPLEYDMSELDALSQAIGELSSDAREARRQRDRIFQILDTLSSSHGEARSMLERHMSEFQQHTIDEEQKYAEIRAIATDYQATKNKAAGAIAAIALFGAAAWEGIKIALRKLGIG